MPTPAITAEQYQQIKDHLPDSIHEIAAIIGEDSALALINQYGGQLLPISTGRTQRGKQVIDRLAQTIGSEKAAKLHRALYPRRFVRIPFCCQAKALLKHQEVIARFDELSRHQTARKAVAILSRQYGITDREIWKILNRPELAASFTSSAADAAPLPSPTITAEQYQQNKDHLPDSIQKIAAIIGEDGALTLINQYGGQSITRRQMTELFGQTAAAQIQASLPPKGRNLYIPRCRQVRTQIRNQQIARRWRELKSNGHTHKTQIAAIIGREIGLSFESSFNIISRMTV